MTRKNISIDDLTAAIEWLNSYDRSDEQDEMADSLIRVIRHLRDEIAAKYADDLKREAIADLKADGKMLTAAGKKQLNALCKAKGETFAANIVSEFDRGSLHYQVRCLVI